MTLKTDIPIEIETEVKPEADPATEAERIYRLLRDLGSSPSRIACTLRERGIKGSRGRPFSCPLAVYLRGQGVVAPLVGASDSVSFGNRRGSVRLPHGARDFVLFFDQGLYPYLDRDLRWGEPGADSTP